MGRGLSGLWNILSIVFVVATVVAIGVIAFLFVTIDPTEEEVVIPEVLSVPSPTLTFTPSNTPTSEPPTFTFTPSWTPTPSRTPSGVPSLTPSTTASPSPTITSTLPASLTPTDTPTPTETVGPTEPPPPPLPFGLQIEPQYTENFINTAGCNWQGVGGQVLDINGQPFNRTLVVHVFSASQDFGRVNTGTNSYFGQSGFEIRIADGVSAGSFFVALETTSGTVVAPRVTLTFPGTCEGNLAQVTFQQTRALN